MRPTIRRRTTACAIACAFLYLASVDSDALGAGPPGELDPTFSEDGKEATSFGGYDWASDVALQPDGKIVVVGSTYADRGRGYDFAVARFNPDGSLDPTFADAGTQTTDFSGFDIATAVAIQPDGRIVVVGSAGDDFGLARYNPDGSLDTAFGIDGRQTTDFGGGPDAAYGIALQADGKIVVVGSASGDFALARYNADGSLDTSFPGDRFPGDGKQTTDFGGGFDYGQAVAIQADGKIVVAGTTMTPPTCDWCWDSSSDFAVARYNFDGSLDTTFSGNGKRTTDFGGDDGASNVAVQADGKIVVVGYSAVFSASATTFALARYNADGSLDATFARGGLQISSFTGTDWASDVALQPDGKIVVVGGGLFDSRGDTDFAVARYTTNGWLDGTFSHGLQATDFGGSEAASGVAIEPGPDGKIIVVGYTCADVTCDFATARYEGGSATQLRR